MLSARTVISARNPLAPVTSLLQGWVTQSWVLVPFSGQLHDFVGTLHSGPLCGEGSALGSSRESWNCIRVRKARVTLTQCNRISDVARMLLPSACLAISLNHFAHFPGLSDGSEHLLLQSLVSMVQAPSLCQRRCAANPRAPLIL